MTRLPRALLGSSLRAWLALIILVAFVPVTVVSGVFAWQNFQNVASQPAENASHVRDVAAARATLALRTVQPALAMLARAPALAADGCDAHLHELLAFQPATVAALGVVDAQGVVQCSTAPIPIPALAAGAGWADSAGWFARLRRGARFSFGVSPIDPASGSRLLIGAVPLLESGRFVGAVCAVLQPDAFTPAAAARQLGAAAWLVPPGAPPVPLVPAPDRAQPPQDGVDAFLAHGDTTVVLRSETGTATAYASAVLDDGYRLLVGVPADRDQAMARRALWRRAVAVAALIGAGLLAVALGSNLAIVRPLKRLNRAVGHWQDGGGFDAGTVGQAPAELRELARSFSAAATSLTEREMQLRGAMAQQELLMQEIHHRVKNNLQIVASLLNLQASRIRLPEARAEFQSARDRVRALATLHRHLYAHGEVHTINMRSFLVELCGQLFQAMGEREGQRIHLDIEAPELRMSSDQAVPLALIVTEAVSNAVKYAFPQNRAGHVGVRLTAEADTLELVVQDDGVGIPAGRGETEAGPRDGIGLQLIRGFARQLGATLAVQEGEGTRYVVRMPLGPMQRDAAAAKRENAPAA